MLCTEVSTVVAAWLQVESILPCAVLRLIDALIKDVLCILLYELVRSFIRIECFSSYMSWVRLTYEVNIRLSEPCPRAFS
jgi:hypothetical protein